MTEEEMTHRVLSEHSSTRPVLLELVKMVWELQRRLDEHLDRLAEEARNEEYYGD